MTPFARADAYKLSHWIQYPKGTTMVYSNFTPRRNRYMPDDVFVFFGLQAFLKQLNQVFKDDFFDLTEDQAALEFSTFYANFFGPATSEFETNRRAEFENNVRALHKLKYLPLEIRALPEGTVVKHGIPCLTIRNTHPDFFWLTNFIETWMSAELWHPCTSATTAFLYRRNFERYALETSDSMFMVDWQGHDFSMRGLPGLDAAKKSGAGHLLSFTGTDTCNTIQFIQDNYGCTGLIGSSVPATEHSVACAGILANSSITIQEKWNELTNKWQFSKFVD